MMEKKHVFIELVSYENEDNKNDPLNGHNYIYDAKNLPDNFYKEYHPVKGSKGSLKNITVDQIYNIKRDQGTYKQFENDCVTVSKQVLIMAGNNNAVNIINGKKLNYEEVYKKMTEYYKSHPIKASQIVPYLDNEEKKDLPWFIRCGIE